MFTCLEYGAVVMQHYQLYTDGFITREEWMIERQLLSYTFQT